MEVKWKIQESGEERTILLEAGQCLFIVGANGSGKSAFLQEIISENPPEKIERISAHTQTCLNDRNEQGTITDSSSGIRISTDIKRNNQEIANFKEEIANSEKIRESRYRDYLGDQKMKRVLTELLFRHWKCDSDFQRRLRSGGTSPEIERERPVAQLNELLSYGKFSFSLETALDNREIYVRHIISNERYGIEQLSDGERRAVLIASTVLLAEEGTLLMIDEPEQHLHPAITVPFFSGLIEQRKDCKFIFSTHDTVLSAAIPNAGVLIFQLCNWLTKDFPGDFDVRFLAPNIDIPEDLKRDILGEREKILYVEGEENSLDFRLYKVLFPNFSLKPKGSHHNVEQAVNGLRKTQSSHYVEAFGLIDKDFRFESQVNKLVEKGIAVLKVFAVESLYYCPDSFEVVARHKGDEKADDIIKKIKKIIFECLENNEDVAKEMAARRSTELIKNDPKLQKMDWKSFMANEYRDFWSIAFRNPYLNELTQFNELVKTKKLDELFDRYPLHQIQMNGADIPRKIANALGFRTKDEYEKMLIALIQNNQDNLALRLKQRIEMPQAMSGV